MAVDLEELTTHCIRCGFCLESCPTFTTTGSELESPRGRIYLIRSALEGKLDWQEDVREHLDLCLGCRACETACPSGVQYGEILEIARDKIESERPQKGKSALLESTTRPGLLKLQLTAGKLMPGRRIPGFVSRFVSGEAPEADRPEPQKPASFPPLQESSIEQVKGEVYFLEGCAMRVLYPRVHQATRRLLRRAGYVVRDVDQGCCGALHAHNGHLEDARRLAAATLQAFPGDLPVVVNSAGCGSTMKEYGALLGTDEARGFASRVFDLSEFLLKNGLREALAKAPGLEAAVTYHDACHLAHGQRITKPPRELIQAIPGIRFTELPEADTCCGSAGIYNVVEPAMARKLLERKWANVEATDASIVATGNPGCHAWIAQAAREHGRQVSVLHTAELLEAAFSGLEAYLS
ncbi:MAG TPA: (Fe-S)-binding protein [Fimbriimonas sp.]|nr:(Fe-S)-binding protein [Fimbriimonas sp.]